MSEGPLRHVAVRRARPALSLPWLQGVLPARAQTHGDHVPVAARRPGTVRAHERLRRSRRATSPQRTLHLWRCQEMEALSWGASAVAPPRGHFWAVAVVSAARVLIVYYSYTRQT